jgi:hypothetical protein
MLAEAADVPPASVDRVFRTNQAPKDDHAPIGKLGGGKSTPHMKLNHLRNLALGITAQPYTTAVQWVDRICSFTAREVTKWSGAPRASDVISLTPIPDDPAQDGAFAGLLISSNFGRCFERLIEQAAEHKQNSSLHYLTVEVVLDEKNPSVTVVTRGKDGFRYSIVYLPSETAAGASVRSSAFTRSATLRAGIFHTLGDLWRDTLAHLGTGEPISDTAPPASVAPENESAALSRQGEAAQSSDRSNHMGVATPTRRAGSLDSSEPTLRVHVCATHHDVDRSPHRPPTNGVQYVDRHT